MERLIRLATAERERALDPSRISALGIEAPVGQIEALDTLLRSARDYRRHAIDADAWDEVLRAVDSYLAVVQADHITAVKNAGASGV